MRKFVEIISVMAALAAAVTSCNKEDIVGTADGEGLYLNKAEITLIKGNAETLVATVTPKDAASVKWGSEDNAVASVDNKGLVTAVGAGETKITVSAGERTVECLVKVQSPVTSLALDKKEVIIYKGETAEINASVGPSDINVDFKYSWISSDESIFTVAADPENPGKAVITGVMGGYATLYVQAGDVTTSIPVTIDVDLAGLVITGIPEGKTYKGDVFQLGVEKDPIDAIDELAPVWSSSDESVVTVDQTGLVTATGSGTATITVESNGFSATWEVTVKVMTTVSFNPTSSSYQATEDLLYTTTSRFYWGMIYVYSGDTHTFTVPEGLRIAEIKISTYYDNYYPFNATVDNGSYDASSKTWTGDASSVTFSATGRTTYVTGFTVTYKD